MRYMFHLIFLLFIACFQGTLCNVLSIADVSVNLFIIYISIICFLSHKAEGIIISGIYGLVLDILTERFLGVYTVLFVVVAYFIYNMANKVFNEPKFYICALIVLFSSFFINLFYYLIVFISLQSINLKYAIFRVILIETIFDSVISIPIYFLLKRLTDRFYKDKGDLFG